MAVDRDEFSESQKQGYLAWSASMVRDRWPEHFKETDPLPHYICENCAFVSDRRSDFELDHILACEKGGTADRAPQDVIDRILAGDIGLLYQVGANGMLLCVGCNQAKKHHRQFVPPGSGYAWRQHHRDRNPDHVTHGPPPISRKEIEEYPEAPGTWLQHLKRQGRLS